jgi:hypothetical protein
VYGTSTLPNTWGYILQRAWSTMALFTLRRLDLSLGRSGHHGQNVSVDNIFSFSWIVLAKWPIDKIYHPI